ncbi:MAG: RNA-binding S4 domain-containing protein [Lachnospiraceae bacterium]|nr:RNA-binding S4 domain-containing protein [Lachnospiraceae bacterium]
MDNSITIRDEFIKLGQAMKLAGIVGSGVEAKILIEEGQVSVNGENETRRGRKLYKGDSFTYKGNKVTVE